MSKAVEDLFRKGREGIDARMPRRVSKRMLDRIGKRVVVGFIYHNVEGSIWTSLVITNQNCARMLAALTLG